MCYDLSFISSIQQVSDYLHLPDKPSIDFSPVFHRVAQSFQPWPVIIQDHGLHWEMMEWGLIADYMNTPEKINEYRSSMANARSEKILDKKSYWNRIRNQRCLVPTSGFFEHRDVGWKKKVPYFIRLKRQPFFFIAGLYNWHPDRSTGERIGSFALITREGNPMMAAIHNSGARSGRMPLILEKGQEKEWLNPEMQEDMLARILNFEMPESLMEAWPVNSIRRPKEDNESVVKEYTYAGLPPLNGQ
jgi:putative SOS response-associated peptidase YedK